MYTSCYPFKKKNITLANLFIIYEIGILILKSKYNPYKNKYKNFIQKMFVKYLWTCINFQKCVHRINKRITESYYKSSFK